MMTAANLLLQHLQTFVHDNARWQTLIADNLLWELPYAPSLGHPERLMGRQEVVNHATWFLASVENFRFLDVDVHSFIDSQAAVAEFRGEGLIKSTARLYVQNYVLFLRAENEKIAVLREYFDPVRAATALGSPIHGLEC
jgi:hypothetical protein